MKNKTEKEWKKQLTPKQFSICRKGETEDPFSGEYTFFDHEGTYLCVCCKQPLFSSTAKFTTSCGWPSFYEPINNNAVNYKQDFKLNRVRTEVICNYCHAHLGHVFDDGPQPTGKRYCINSIALSFQPIENNVI